MSWPQATDYNEALQNPAIAFKDEELRRGQPVLSALGLPMPCSGNFADVYQVGSAGGSSSWAVKCFTRDAAERERRFAAISHHLAQRRLPFMVDFKYLADGVLIRGLWYPVLKMHWVEGITLSEFIKEHLNKPAMLLGLARVWVRLAHELREAGIAHGDLQHGNVLMVGSKAGKLGVKLVDYDGMYVPALAAVPSGESGHPNYQHPQRLRDGYYDFEVDRFSHLIIYTALRALAVMGPKLWEKYDNGDNVLFRETDFASPGSSPLLRELLAARDPQVAALAGRLFLAANGDVRNTPLLRDILTAEEKALPLNQSEAREVKQLIAQGGTVRAVPSLAPVAAEVPWYSTPATKTAPSASVPTATATAPAPASKPRRASKPARRASYRQRSASRSGIVVLMLFLLGVTAAGLWLLPSWWQADVAETRVARHTRPELPPQVQPTLPQESQPRIPDNQPPPRETFPHRERPSNPRPPVDRPPGTPPSMRSPYGNMIKTFNHVRTDGKGPTRIWTVSFMDNGRSFFSLGEDGSIRFWDVQSGRETRLLYVGSRQRRDFHCAVLSPQEDRIVVANDDGLTEVDLDEKKFDLREILGQRAVNAQVGYVRMGAGDLTHVLTGGPESLRVWDLNRRTLQKQHDPYKVGHAPFAISPKHDQVVLMRDQGNAHIPVICRVSDMRELGRLQSTGMTVTHMAMDSRATVLVASTTDKTTLVWDLRTGEMPGGGYTSGHIIHALAIDPRGTRFVTMGEDGQVYFYDLTGKGDHKILFGPPFTAHCLAFSPDGRYLLAAGDDSMVRLWELAD